MSCLMYEYVFEGLTRLTNPLSIIASPPNIQFCPTSLTDMFVTVTSVTPLALFNWKTDVLAFK